MCLSVVEKTYAKPTNRVGRGYKVMTIIREGDLDRDPLLRVPAFRSFIYASHVWPVDFWQYSDAENVEHAHRGGSYVVGFHIFKYREDALRYIGKDRLDAWHDTLNCLVEVEYRQMTARGREAVPSRLVPVIVAKEMRILSKPRSRSKYVWRQTTARNSNGKVGVQRSRK